ncbi:MAG TPA: hypothetical protein VFW26_08330, partial [Gaiellales bacterium]|nr:hypothetical protein [Gaiellales bacterium]
MLVDLRAQLLGRWRDVRIGSCWRRVLPRTCLRSIRALISTAWSARLTATRTIHAAIASLARADRPGLARVLADPDGLVLLCTWTCVPRSPESADPRPIGTRPERQCTPIERHPGVS